MNALPERSDFDVRLPHDAQKPTRQSAVPLAQILVDLRALAPGDMLRAVAMQDRSSARIGEVLVAHGLANEANVYQALAIQHDCAVVDLVQTPPDPRLIAKLGAESCLRLKIVPWRMIGASPVIVTAEPNAFQAMLSTLPVAFHNAMMAVAPATAIEKAITGVASAPLLHKAETRVPADMSSRTWHRTRFVRGVALFLGIMACLAAFATNALIVGLCLAAMLALCSTTLLKVFAMAATLWPQPAKLVFRSARGKDGTKKLPGVSLIIALRDEPVIVPGLVHRLRRLNYPVELLDIWLVTEHDDRATAQAIGRLALPQGVRHLVVPNGQIKTKPRALNYALSFCRGSIVGVLDAEDAPEPDQIHSVVRHFGRAGDDLACLQGVLDFYNPRANLLSRCFTLEYAAWFRVFLPGLARLGLIVPLGGTTAYFRRDILERIGGWDAHNVTEDADLGVRLSRMGYRTELVSTVTYEEANGHFWPWIKQRSRWLKGYAMTWAVHMRKPGQLLQELGIGRFVAFQVLFVGTIMHFLLAPVLFSLWVLPFGLPHPVSTIVGPNGATWLFALFFSAELTGFSVVGVGLARAGKLRMLAWILALPLYFWLATVSLYRALLELAIRPYFWDKTPHGQSPRYRKTHKNKDRRSKSLFRRPVSGAFRTPG